MLKLDLKFSVFSYWHLFVCSMEHESDDDVLIIHDETDDQIKVEFKVESETEDLFRQIDEALAEEPIVTKFRYVPLAPSQPAGESSRLKKPSHQSKHRTEECQESSLTLYQTSPSRQWLPAPAELILIC